MPFPANWLEELIVEWLDLEGFTTSTGVSVSAEKGGRYVPDVVGAKMADGRLLIRHCEATMWFTDGPQRARSKFRDKFSYKVEGAVRRYFIPVFNEEVVQQAEYQKWVITCGASAPVQAALAEGVPGIRICILRDFIFETVLPVIDDWRLQRFRKATLPNDKWLLQMIDVFSSHRLLSRPTERNELAQTTGDTAPSSPARSARERRSRRLD